MQIPDTLLSLLFSRDPAAREQALFIIEALEIPPLHLARALFALIAPEVERVQRRCRVWLLTVEHTASFCASAVAAQILLCREYNNDASINRTYVNGGGPRWPKRSTTTRLYFDKNLRPRAGIGGLGILCHRAPGYQTTGATIGSQCGSAVYLPRWKDGLPDEDARHARNKRANSDPNVERIWRSGAVLFVSCLPEHVGALASALADERAQSQRWRAENARRAALAG